MPHLKRKRTARVERTQHDAWCIAAIRNHCKPTKSDWALARKWNDPHWKPRKKRRVSKRAAGLVMTHIPTQPQPQPQPITVTRILDTAPSQQSSPSIPIIQSILNSIPSLNLRVTAEDYMITQPAPVPQIATPVLFTSIETPGIITEIALDQRRLEARGAPINLNIHLPPSPLAIRISSVGATPRGSNEVFLTLTGSRGDIEFTPSQTWDSAPFWERFSLGGDAVFGNPINIAIEEPILEIEYPTSTQSTYYGTTTSTIPVTLPRGQEDVSIADEEPLLAIEYPTSTIPITLPRGQDDVKIVKMKSTSNPNVLMIEAAPSQELLALPGPEGWAPPLTTAWSKPAFDFFSTPAPVFTPAPAPVFTPAPAPAPVFIPANVRRTVRLTAPARARSRQRTQFVYEVPRPAPAPAPPPPAPFSFPFSNENPFTAVPEKTSVPIRVKKNPFTGENVQTVKPKIDPGWADNQGQEEKGRGNVKKKKPVLPKPVLLNPNAKSSGIYLRPLISDNGQAINLGFSPSKNIPEKFYKIASGIFTADIGSLEASHNWSDYDITLNGKILKAYKRSNGTFAENLTRSMLWDQDRQIVWCHTSDGWNPIAKGSVDVKMS